MTPVPPRVYLQDTCLKHKFIRSKETSDVYERPERIRAINIGIAAIYARLEEANPGLLTSLGDKSKGSKSTITGPLTIIRSAASLDMRVHKASLAVHSGDDTDGTQWFLADDIEEWCVKSLDKIQRNLSEIPDRLEQDLYLGPESLSAFEAALGTVCEAVDNVCRATGVAHESSDAASRWYKEIGHPSPRAFVVIRPPGHHCGEDSPAGFGFVNNVAVGAFHAFEEHRLSRIVIFDYDLHHGNGTQEIVRSFQTPKIYYGSMHDILSYPCEAGNQELINDASLQLHGGVEGEWVHNVHLLPYKTEDEFWKHYKERYSTIFTKAEEFLQSTGGPGDDVIVFLSCGFDASEYETTEMSRHDRHVPTSFYHRFTREACAFADKWAGGRLVSVLEGGYSDKALTSGAISHLAGLAEAGGLRVDKKWWSPDELNLIEKVTSKRRGRKPKLDHFDWWLQRMQQIFQNINKEAPPPAVRRQSQLFIAPPPPVHHEETPESTPVRIRRRRTKPPPPPPTSMVTRKAKRASPDDHEHMELSANKRRRRNQEEEEEEESSGESYSSYSDEDVYMPPRSATDKGKGRAVPDVHTESASKPSNVRAFVGSREVYKGRQATGPTSTAPAPVQRPNTEESTNSNVDLPTNVIVAAAPKPAATPNGADAEKPKASTSSRANGSSASTTARKELHISTSGLIHSQKQSSTPAIASDSTTKATHSPNLGSASASSKSAVAPPSAPSSSMQQTNSLQPKPTQPCPALQTASSPQLPPPLQTPNSTPSATKSPRNALSSHPATLDDAQRSLTNVSSILSGHLSVMPEPTSTARIVSLESLHRGSVDHLVHLGQTLDELQKFADAMPSMEDKLSNVSSRLQAMLKDMNAVRDRLAGL